MNKYLENNDIQGIIDNLPILCNRCECETYNHDTKLCNACLEDIERYLQMVKEKGKKVANEYFGFFPLDYTFTEDSLKVYKEDSTKYSDYEEVCEKYVAFSNVLLRYYDSYIEALKKAIELWESARNLEEKTVCILSIGYIGSVIDEQNKKLDIG